MNCCMVLMIGLLLVGQAWSMPNHSKGYRNDEYNMQNDEEDGEPNDEDDSVGSDDDDEENTFIYTKPMSIRVKPGSDVWFFCNASNTGDHAVRWFRDGLPLTLGDSIITEDGSLKTRLVVYKNNTILIRNVTTNDSSDAYTCDVVTLSEKGNPNVTHRLLVEDNNDLEDYAITLQPSRGTKIAVNHGEKLEVGCTTNVHSKIPKIVISHDGKRVAITRTNSQGAFVDYPRAERRHAGTYQCLLETGGDPVTAWISVIVTHKPEIEVAERHVAGGIGKPAKLVCHVHAHPSAFVDWFKDGEILDKSTEKYSISGSSGRDSRQNILVIQNVEEGDFGEYQCRAKNAQGEATGEPIRLSKTPSKAVFQVGDTVPGKPVIWMDWKVMSFWPLEESEVRYRPANKVDWKVSNAEILKSDGPEYLIKTQLSNLEPGDYEVKVRARNEHGFGPESVRYFKGEYQNSEPASVVHPRSGNGAAAMTSLSLLLVMVASLSLVFRPLNLLL